MKVLALTTAALALATGLQTAQATTIEIMHHWRSLSESGALAVFEDAYRNQGGEWIEDIQPNQATHNERTFQRLRDGFPPTVSQSQATGLQEFVRSGVLSTLEDLVPEETLSRISPELRELITFNGQTAAVPITVHGSNWTYYNRAIMDEFGFEPAKSWDAFLTQMEEIQAAGRPTIAIGEARWERMLVLEMILLAEGGPGLLDAFNQGNITEEYDPAFKRAMAHFMRFQDLITNSAFQVTNFSAASIAVAKGLAAAQIMGDWGKGEMVAAGFEPGKDFLCALAPGTDETYILILDIFLLPRSEFAEDQAAQRDFVSIALDPVNQAEFSRRKGSLPVVGVDRDTLDECGRKGLDTIEAHGFVNAQNRLVAAPGVEAAIDQFIRNVMADSYSSASAAEADLRVLFKAALGQ